MEDQRGRVGWGEEEGWGSTSQDEAYMSDRVHRRRKVKATVKMGGKNGEWRDGGMESLLVQQWWREWRSKMDKMEDKMEMDGPIDNRMGYKPYGSYGPYRMGGFSGSETVPSQLQATVAGRLCHPLTMI